VDKITNIRYGKLGKILFDFRGIVIAIDEPRDVLLVGFNDAVAAKWIRSNYGFLLASVPNSKDREA
jgi:hypothetical protein